MSNIKKILKSKLVTNSIWLLALQGFNTIVPMLTLPYVTRVLGAAGYGTFSIALNWILYFQVLVEYGFAFWGARKIAVNGKTKIQETFEIIISARILLLIFAFCTMLIVYFLSGKDISHLYSMMILFCMVIGAAFQLTWLFQGMQDMKYITIINAIAKMVSLALIFVFVKNENAVFLYCALYASTNVISGILGMMLAKKKYGIKLVLCHGKQIMNALIDAWPLFVSQAMAKIVSGIGLTVLGIIYTDDVAGIYAAIYKIPYILVLIFMPISQALYPEISSCFAESYTRGLIKVKKISLFIVPVFIIMALVLILLREYVIKIVIGIEYIDYCDLVIPLCLWVVVSIVNNFFGVQTLVGSAHQKEYSRAFAISAVAAVALNILLGMIYSVWGIAYASLISEIILSILLFVELMIVNKREKDKVYTLL